MHIICEFTTECPILTFLINDRREKEDAEFTQSFSAQPLTTHVLCGEFKQAYWISKKTSLFGIKN